MEAIFIRIIFSFLFSWLITFFLVPLCASLAHRFQVIDFPDGKIKNHAQPTPYLGGIAIYIGFLCGIAFTVPFENRLFLLLVGTMLLLFIGFIDDVLVLKPHQKFFGQIIAALCFLKAGFYLKEHLFYNVWNLPISFLWILTIINAFNLVDIMDGLATLLAINAIISFCIIAFLLHNITIVLLLAAFLGALMAFFWYNKPPAQIYLGDAGSLVIGGFLAIIPFCLDWGTYNQYGYFTPIIILGIPLLEVTSLIIIRMCKGIPFYQGSPDHFACYLRIQGWNVYEILAYVSFLSIILGASSISFLFNYLPLAELCVIGGGFLFVWSKILRYI